ncbi:unnamed protein product [Arctia plantaginis]|uniref:Uncharacterized protein n=1 Tax=Arctia plantaginis TaxID=874455 RepID=A0A8S1BSG1_ARCPL|nr:unnamed protein product [Arctia plantaginis]
MFFERILLSVFYLGIEAFSLALAEEVEIRDVGADKGTNVTIPCGDLATLTAPNVQWVHRGNKTHHEVLVSPSFNY